ncbi:adenylate/guanylate cyclase domain-containing protein, partial [Streptomyces sp. MUM 203J]|uniref:adenylate/guanylate cyclase domain-containing protein n=1 Tax=Streptomyces sp. MUM 203J TaxID=2791990 RepID=UPI001F0359F7
MTSPTCSSCRHDLPEAARFCPSCGTARTVPAPVPDDERKPVTVLFCDLVGSTALSGTLDPEALRTVTLRYFRLMSEQIEARGGTPEKFIGDAVMAVFGVPRVREDDARRALGAALGMREALAGLNGELEATLGIRLDIRIGVNTGQVVAAAQSSARQALVSGETVNVAARLEQSAAPGEILVGPETLLAAGPTAVVEEVGPLVLRGKAEPVRAHRLLALGTDDPELLRRFDVPFVGRGTERAALDRALDGPGSSAAGVLSVVGEAGVGKTRLVREWRDARAARGPLLHGAGRCRSYGAHGSLTPLADAVREALSPGAPTAGPAAGAEGSGGTTGSAGTGVAGSQDAGAAGTAGPGGEGCRRVRDAWALLQDGLLRDGTPNAPLEELCAALASVLRDAAGGAPVLLLLDDWHWAAPLLVRTVHRLRELLVGAQVLMVCVGRPDGVPPAPEAGRWLRLGGLPAGDVAVLARELAGERGAPAPGLLERAEGNPLYLEQLLVPAGDGDARLPPTLQALLGARIGALDPAERAALDLASVLGRDFTAADLARMSGAAHQGGEAEAGVVGALAGLCRRRLVEPVPGRPGRHRFCSGLVHEVAYASLSKRAKADRHEWAADLPSTAAAGDAVAGGHLERAYRCRARLGLLDARTARLRERAAVALGRAGAQALAGSDLHWAESLLRTAVDLAAPDTPTRLPALRGLGEVRLALGEAEEGAALLREVLASGRSPVEAAHAGLALAVLDGDDAGIAATARRVLPVFEEAGDSAGQARARLRLAQQRQRAGRHEEADRDLVRALAHAARAEAEPERAAALGAIGVSLWRGPEPVERALSRCRALLAEHGEGRPTVRVTLNCPLAVLYTLRGRPREAEAALAEADQVAAGMGYAEVRVFLPVFRATVEALLGRRGRALALLRAADGSAAEIGATGFRRAIALEAARLSLDMNHHVRAHSWLAAMADATGPRELPRADVVDLAGLRARLAAREGDAGRALREAESAVRMADLTDSPLVRATAALDQARTLAALGRRDGAVAAAWSAAEYFSDKGHRPGTRTAGRLLTELGGAEPGGTGLGDIADCGIAPGRTAPGSAGCGAGKPGGMRPGAIAPGGAAADG